MTDENRLKALLLAQLAIADRSAEVDIDIAEGMSYWGCALEACAEILFGGRTVARAALEDAIMALSQRDDAEKEAENARRH